jgi:hypothetical protein
MAAGMVSVDTTLAANTLEIFAREPSHIDGDALALAR